MAKSRILVPGESGDSPYKDIGTDADWDQYSDEYDAYLLTPEGRRVQRGAAITSLVRAVGGPYDGYEINVPPGGDEVSLPSAFGDGDLHGSSVYKHVVNLVTGETTMQYIGQSEHTDDEDDDGSD